MTYQQWEWDALTKTYKAPQCHTGNTEIYSEPNGGTLFIGGWSNGAIVTQNTHVIDLTGTEHKWQEIPMAFDDDSRAFFPFIQQTCAGWLSLPFPDMGTPAGLNSYEQWYGISMQIQNILKKGRDVLVACLGGHGRSGMFCSIVGYILGVKTNRAWASPVEHIRMVHCEEAVETYKQEKYVYDILGLDIKITHLYATNTRSDLQSCPICGTQSIYIKELGMCMSCKNQFEHLAPVKHDLTEDDLKSIVKHDCVNENCIGIYKADVCGHIVHDMLIVDGLCENCAWEAEFAKKADEMEDDKITYGKCALCDKNSLYGYRFGICYECSQDLIKKDKVDFVHNSITDPYRAIPHHCDSISCVGIIVADKCNHVVHNREVEDGLCPDCLQLKGKE